MDSIGHGPKRDNTYRLVYVPKGHDEHDAEEGNTL
jgi:hypothetical protein